jgi:hypothetical protein
MHSCMPPALFIALEATGVSIHLHYLQLDYFSIDFHGYVDIAELVYGIDKDLKIPTKSLNALL